MELEENQANIRRQGLGLAAISYDSTVVLKDFAGRKNITYPLLSDTESKIIRAFGILNETVPAGTPFFGIPHPGTFIINPNGTVASKYFEEDFRERYTSSDILVRQFGVEPGSPQETTETKHLRLSASASRTTVDPGQWIALVMDIDLKPGMHVYAPGVEGYIPIEWSMKVTDAAKVHPVEYPASKKLLLPAINETVPVYQGQFRLVREITIGADNKIKPLLDAKGDLMIEGTFRYQACDDRVCYVPQSIPLKWVIHYQALDRQRIPAELQRKAPGR